MDIARGNNLGFADADTNRLIAKRYRQASQMTLNVVIEKRVTTQIRRR